MKETVQVSPIKSFEIFVWTFLCCVLSLVLQQTVHPQFNISRHERENLKRQTSTIY